jgi:cyclopropane-fatty-acyl-phospholipid synthase
MSVHLDFIGGTRPGVPLLARWSRRHVAAMLEPAGVILDGGRPWDPQIHRPHALTRVFFGGTLGAGESFIDGDWDCDALDEFTARLVRAGVERPLTGRSAAAVAGALLAIVRNTQTRAHAKEDIRSHYDIGNDLYAAMLGRTMAYSCGYWGQATTLDEAQDAKHDLICRKLGLGPGMRLLDIGCGWGALAKHAAERYQAIVTGVTISPAQAALARTRCAGLPVEILEQDYRDAAGTFDRVASVGMLEHVGPHNYTTFFDVAKRVLTPDGLLLLHTIGGPRSIETCDPWIAKYVFPHSVLPSAAQLTHAFEGRFVLEDWENFGADYDRTLMAWWENVESAWGTLSRSYSERFHRLWRYYLLTCAGAFRARGNQLWQLVLSPQGVAGGYRRPNV